MSIKHKTIAIQQSIETGDRFPLSYFDSRQYIQHNLAIGDGLGSLLGFLDALPPGSSRVTPLRAFEEGDISFAHLEYVLAPLGRLVGFEVHRWENGRIVEHWDNLQPVPDRPNPSGRTMTDGPTEVTDLDKTEENKRHVERFVGDVLIGRRHERIEHYVHGEGYRRHHPSYGDGPGELRRMLSPTADGAGVAYQKLHRVLGEGSFCLSMSEGTVNGAPSAFYDLFQVTSGKIAEHWDVVEPIPPREQWQNDNGKF